MISAIGLLGAAAVFTAMVVWATLVRRAVARDGLALAAAAMPAGAAQEGG
jgi:hypothetical protein